MSVHHYCFPCESIRCQLHHYWKRQFGVSSSLLETIRCQFIIMRRQFGVSSSLLLPCQETIRCQFIIIASLASSRCETIRCQFIIIADNSVRQFGVSSSLLLPLQSSRCETIRVSGDNSVSVHHYETIRGDNSVSVHHYCFPCIKSVSWIQETIRCQFIIGDNSVSVHHYCFPCINSVSSSLILPLETIRCQFIIIASPCGRQVRCKFDSLEDNSGTTVR